MSLHADLLQEGVPQYTLYVTNLAPSCDEGFLYQVFAPYGTILSVKIARTISGACKGYAFVNFIRFEVRAARLTCLYCPICVIHVSDVV